MRDRSYEAFLFDMDGTVLTSLVAAERVWTRWALRRRLDPAAVLAVMHGVRAEDTVRRFAPGCDILAEANWITEQESEELEGVAEIPGAAALLSALPPDRWAVVTSAPRRLALKRLAAAGLPVPGVLVAAEDVDRGKPDPQPYRRAAAALGRDIQRCLVWEDAPAGIASGLAAQASVIAIDPRRLGGNGAETTISDFRALRVVVGADHTLRLAGLPEAAV